jgi:hypothetical protein
MPDLVPGRVAEARLKRSRTITVSRSVGAAVHLCRTQKKTSCISNTSIGKRCLGDLFVFGPKTVTPTYKNASSKMDLNMPFPDGVRNKPELEVFLIEKGGPGAVTLKPERPLSFDRRLGYIFI